MADATRYKYPLKLPQSLKDTAVRLAAQDGVSLNQWIVAAVAQKIGAVETAEVFLARRSKGADVEAALEVLARAPDVAPDNNDEIT